MFDIGFWELILIGVVALLVIGPERLPGVARKAGMWLGRGRRFVSQVKADIDREIAADELRRVLKEQAESAGIHDILDETKEAVNETRSTLDESRRQVERGADDPDQPEQEYLVKASRQTDTAASTEPASPATPDQAPRSEPPSDDAQDKR